MALYIFGVISVIVSILIGLFSGSFWLFLLALAVGVIFAAILFALAIILERQETILYSLQQQGNFLKKQFGIATKRCANCHYEFDVELSSCPRCGSREIAS